MVKQVLIDTDTVSYFFRRNPNVIVHFDEYLKTYDFINLSVVTYYEVLNGLYYKDAQRQLQQFQAFSEMNNILDLTSEIAQKAAEIYANLRKQGFTIGHNDILIAATAIVNDMILVTNNTKHFQVVDGLEFVNWLEV